MVRTRGRTVKAEPAGPATPQWSSRVAAGADAFDALLAACGRLRFEQAGFVRTHTGSFTARDAGRSGLLRLDPDRPQHFIWEGTGRHYF